MFNILHHYTVHSPIRLLNKLTNPVFSPFNTNFPAFTLEYSAMMFI